MAALGNSRTLLPVEYPLSSLTSWSDAAAAAAVGYSYPCTTPPVAHQFVYSGGRLASGPHPYSCPGVGTLGVPDSSCSMYSSWRHHPNSPLSFYCQPEAEWILRQSKLESPSHPFSHRPHQPEQQRWKVTSDSSALPRRDVATASTTTANRPSGGPVCGLQFGTAGASADSSSHDGISVSCGAGLSPVVDAWTTAGRSSVTTVDQYIRRGQGLQETRAVPSHTGKGNGKTKSPDDDDDDVDDDDFILNVCYAEIK